ncbi:type II secretion system ATPase GspE [Myxococcota bacterium]|nr:type II secretion system ATPase GspE [Myxococcota bacterium]MBU1429456.1 type II secretion system ATPase GspE [Myxococcota bacterium]MBU1897475.1 type II secretion system ATPase GspE [Myxococcota bacterium]
MNFELRIAKTLIEQGLLRPDRLEEARELAEEKDIRLSEALLRINAVREMDLLTVTANAVGMRVLKELDVEDVDLELSHDMEIAFARAHQVLPLWRKSGRVQVGVADPLSQDPLDAMRVMFHEPIEPILVPEGPLNDAINKVFDRMASADSVLEGMNEEEIADHSDGLEIENFDLIDGTDDAPIIRLVNSILTDSVKERASDVHIEPFEHHISVRFRIDGVLKEKIQPPKRLHASISSRIKVMAGLDIAEKRIPQDGRIKLKVAGKEIDIRLSTVPTSHGERLVMRLLDKTTVLHDLDYIGMGDQVLLNMNNLLNSSYGIILVTGPTGSGKTTTLYSGLAKINSPTRNIITVEDPVEYQLGGIGQIQVNTKVGLTFAAGLRSILRQDPDVVMVGEIRDAETAEIAIQASLTGHLVFSTLHTNDAASAVTRLVDMGVQPFLVSSSVIGMLAQRLIRTLCPHCKERVVPSEDDLMQLGYTRERFLRMTPGYVFRPKGCQECLDSGFKGRSGIYELILVDDDIRGLITKNVPSNEIKKMAIMKKGMLTLRDDGARRVMMGDTSIAEVLRVTQDDNLDLEGVFERANKPKPDFKPAMTDTYLTSFTPE